MAPDYRASCARKAAVDVLDEDRPRRQRRNPPAICGSSIASGSNWQRLLRRERSYFCSTRSPAA